MTEPISASGPPALLDSSLVREALSKVLSNQSEMNRWELEELSAAVAHMGHCGTFASMLSVATQALPKIPKARPVQRQAAIAILKPLTDEARRLEKLNSPPLPLSLPQQSEAPSSHLRSGTYS